MESPYFMEVCNHFDILLEALTCLGRRAAGRDWNAMAQRIAQQSNLPSAELLEVLGVLQHLTDELDLLCPLEEPLLKELFGDLEGFPHNTIGSASRAFFLLYPILDQYQGDPAEFARLAAARDGEQVAWGIASIFEEDLPASRRLSPQQYLDLILSLAVPDSTRMALLALSRNYAQVTIRAMDCLTPVLDYLTGHQPLMEQTARPFLQSCAQTPPEQFFAQLSRMTPESNVTYLVYPFLFGADTVLTLPLSDGRVRFYCGVLRRELQNLVSGSNSAQDQVCEIYRLLGDPTRFYILCYLRGHNAYVQELSHQFGLSRNTIHHHMNKLMDCGLVHCMVHGNRMYYSLDQERMQLFLKRQKLLFDQR